MAAKEEGTADQVYKSRIEAIYAEHNPDGFAKIDELLQKYDDSHVLYKKICKKYDVTPLRRYKETSPEQATQSQGNKAKDGKFGIGELVKTRVVFSQSEEERWVFAVITDSLRKQKKELYDLVVINAEEHSLNPFATHVSIEDIQSMKTFDIIESESSAKPAARVTLQLGDQAESHVTNAEKSFSRRTKTMGGGFVTTEIIDNFGGKDETETQALNVENLNTVETN